MKINKLTVAKIAGGVLTVAGGIVSMIVSDKEQKKTLENLVKDQTDQK